MQHELALESWHERVAVRPAPLLDLIRFYQDALPHTKVPYSRKTWGHPLHSLCSYQGKLKPAHAHWLIRTFTCPGDLVLDPLGGVGTVAFEAGIQGRRSCTIDINPFPYAVATGKVDPPSVEEVQRFLPVFLDRVWSVSLNEDDLASTEFGLNARVKDYYHPDTLKEVLQARRYFLDRRDLSRAEVFFKACTLHILHGNRPYALSRNSHPVTPFAPTGPFERRFLEKSLSEKCERALSETLPTEFIRGKSHLDDFRSAASLLDGPADVIVTSPPFLGLRFDRPNWLRLWFCGWGAADFHHTSEAHLERQQTKSLEVYRDFFKICAEVSRPRAPMLIHVGGSKFYNMIEALKKHADGLFRLVGDIGEDVTLVANHGIVDKGTTSRNHVLVFERA